MCNVHNLQIDCLRLEFVSRDVQTEKHKSLIHIGFGHTTDPYAWVIWNWAKWMKKYRMHTHTFVFRLQRRQM